MERVARFAASSETVGARFEMLQQERAKKRAEIEAFEASHGSQPLIPICQDMCPEYEQLERELHLDVHPFEAKQGIFNHGSGYVMDPAKAVKKYHRPAAGNEVPLPEDIRTPECLLRTLHYLLSEVLDSKQHSFADIHSFIRDRTRSIRQDLTLQGCRDAHSVDIHEQIARFHIISGHLLCEADPAEFDAFQNTEQLRKVLQSLHEMYSDTKSVVHENEPEFRAYYILTHLQDPNIFRTVLDFPDRTLTSRSVQFALTSAAAFHQGNYAGYCRLIKNGDYLQAALLHTHLTALRSKALNIMSNAYHEAVPFDYIQRTLLFQDYQETANFLVQHGLLTGDQLNFETLSKPSEAIRPRQLALIEAKRYGKPYSVMICNRPVSVGIEKGQILQFKERMKYDIYNALVDFCVPILVSGVSMAVYNELAASFTSNIIEYKKQLQGRLTAIFLDRAVDELLTEVLDGVVRERHKLEQVNKRKMLVEDTFISFVDEFLEDQLISISQESLAEYTYSRSLISHSLRSWFRLLKRRQIQRISEKHHMDRIQSDLTSASCIFNNQYKPACRPNRVIDLDSVFSFIDAVVWITYEPSSINVRLKSAGRIELIRNLTKSPHLAICMPDERSRVETMIMNLNVPWPIYVACMEELCTLTLDNQIPELQPMSEELLRERLEALVWNCSCTAEYRKKLNNYMNNGVQYLYFEDPAKMFHPHFSTDAIFPASLEAVEKQLRDLTCGLDTPSYNTPRKKRSFPSSPPPDMTPHLGKLRRVIKESRRLSSVFDNALDEALQKAS